MNHEKNGMVCLRLCFFDCLGVTGVVWIESNVEGDRFPFCIRSQHQHLPQQLFSAVIPSRLVFLHL